MIRLVNIRLPTHKAKANGAKRRFAYRNRGETKCLSPHRDSWFLPLPTAHLFLIAAAADDTQHHQKKIDEIEVKGQGTHDGAFAIGSFSVGQMFKLLGVVDG